MTRNRRAAASVRPQPGALTTSPSSALPEDRTPSYAPNFSSNQADTNAVAPAIASPITSIVVEPDLGDGSLLQKGLHLGGVRHGRSSL